jgi:hypothetical protein
MAAGKVGITTIATRTLLAMSFMSRPPYPYVGGMILPQLSIVSSAGKVNAMGEPAAIHGLSRPA